MRLAEDWKELSTIVIFGWGRYGQDSFTILKRDFNIAYIIDNDDEKNGTFHDNTPIVSLSEAIEKIKNYKIIVTASQKAYADISRELVQLGLQEFKNFCKLEDFVTEWYWIAKRQAVLYEVHMAITTKCTLKCQNCNMFIPYYEKADNMSYEELIKDIDAFFQVIDYTYKLVLLGGEPFLHGELVRIVTYIMNHYRSKIGFLLIVTNATVLPSDEMCSVLSKYDVHLSISNYTDAVSYKLRLEEFVEKIQRNNITYEIRKEIKWCDFGFPNRKFNFSNVREHMLCCGPVFHGLNDGKIYYCHVAWSAEKCGLYQLKAGDYFELVKPDNMTMEQWKELALAHCRGDMSSGYVSLCQVCGGCGQDNNCIIPAGIQKESE